MWVVKNSKGETIATCSRKEDADAIANTKLDDEVYRIEQSE